MAKNQTEVQEAQEVQTDKIQAEVGLLLSVRPLGSKRPSRKYIALRAMCSEDARMAEDAIRQEYRDGASDRVKAALAAEAAAEAAALYAQAVNK